MTQALFSDVADGYAFGIAGGAMGEARALLSLERGSVHWIGEDGVGAQELPKDIDSGPYLALPGKAELGLGRDLVIAFAEAQLPNHIRTVVGFFRKRGAYGRFKTWLEAQGQLQAWHAYEAAATEARLRQWCAEHGIALL